LGSPTVADQRLDTLIITMNAATGVEHPLATAAAVTEMVAQSQTIRGTMTKPLAGMTP